MKLLNKVSQLIATFFIGHPNAILYYQCDDISDVPMSFKKKKKLECWCRNIVIGYLLVCLEK